jgi:hypothetical protein
MIVKKVVSIGQFKKIILAKLQNTKLLWLIY